MRNEARFIYTGQRWEILQAITKGHTTATTIAQALNSSIPHIHNQLKLLEAANYITQTTTNKEATIGKPRTHYAITKELAIITAIKPGNAHTITIRPAKKMGFIFNTLFMNNEEELYYLQKFYYTHEEFILKTQMTALIEQDSESSHFLIITPDVEATRKHHSNIIIKHPSGKERKIAIWSHTLDEAKQGLRNNEDYYKDKIAKAMPFWDEQNHLEDLKKLLPGETT